MKSLRAKLFLSIGSILLIIAILSYAIPKIFVKKDIDQASDYINVQLQKSNQKLRHLASSWVTYRFLHSAAYLDAISHMLQIEKKGMWETAVYLISADPEIAIVQVTEDHQTAVISTESALLYTPLWARDAAGALWIKIAERNKVFSTKSLEVIDQRNYLLFSSEKVPEDLVFTEFKKQKPPEFSEENAQAMYQALHWRENLQVQKIELIQRLLPWREKASGILQVDSSFKNGVCLLSDEVFFTAPIVDATVKNPNPFVVFREEGPFVDLVQFASFIESAHQKLAIGISISNIGREIAEIIQKPILLYENNKLLQAFTEEGEVIALNRLTFPDGKIEWNDALYIPFPVKMGPMTLSILTPEAEKKAISSFLSHLRDSLIAKISSNLLIVAFLLFVIALLVLARLSKSITQPITLLAVAADEIAKGKYEDLVLPPAENRHDEVSVLSHAFEQMVIALRDREKIRGVLNKVVSKEIAAQVLNSSIELGGEERFLTMLFIDIRGFTPLSETMPPPKLIKLLNTYMTRMCRFVDETHGVVDKFIGDAIMALYGAPLEMQNHAEKAIEAAILMIEDLKKWNEEYKAQKPIVTAGIGIHTGIASAGNMGSENRLNYTVVGANVNIAARLCSAAKPMQILISEETYQALADPTKFRVIKLAPIQLKGIDFPVPVYEVLS